MLLLVFIAEGNRCFGISVSASFVILFGLVVRRAIFIFLAFEPSLR